MLCSGSRCCRAPPPTLDLPRARQERLRTWPSCCWGPRRHWQQGGGGEDPSASPGRGTSPWAPGPAPTGWEGRFSRGPNDATAASWNPAGLSYLRAPELSLVGVHNSFTTVKNLDNDSLKGSSVDFAAFTWPVGAGEVRGAVEITTSVPSRSMARATWSSTGRPSTNRARRPAPQLVRVDDGVSDGGLTYRPGHRPALQPPAARRLHRQPLVEWVRPEAREKHLQPAHQPPASRLRPRLPPERLELQLRADRVAVRNAEPGRRLQDSLHGEREPRPLAPRLMGRRRRPTITTNAWSSNSVRVDFPSSLGVGLSWRLRNR